MVAMDLAGPDMYDRRITQVHALVAAPFLLEQPGVSEMFPADAISRAKRMLEVCKQPSLLLLLPASCGPCCAA